MPSPTVRATQAMCSAVSNRLRSACRVRSRTASRTLGVPAARRAERSNSSVVVVRIIGSTGIET